jgi:ankyrin repeat protein
MSGFAAISFGLARGPRAGEGDVMAVLPAHPHLGQLRNQAKDLLHAARAGDPPAVGRLRAVSADLTLASAQLVVAREYGFASWAGLKAAVQARSTEFGELVREFCQASIRDWTGRAVRMLAATPEIDGSGYAAALVLGDAARVRATLRRNPALATRPDTRTGWTPLHVVCASRWHDLDPARAGGLVAVASLLLAAGADPGAHVGCSTGWSPLRCAVAGAENPAIARLLLDHGAVPEDSDFYLACFGNEERESLRLLLAHAPAPPGSGVLAAPISGADTETVRLLLEAGVDASQPAQADLYGAGYSGDPPCPPVYAAVRSGCPAGLVELLLAHGADPAAPGPDGRSPHRLASQQGDAEAAALLRRHGAPDDTTPAERLLGAYQRGDRAATRRLLAGDPGLPGRLTAGDMGEALIRAAEGGNTAAVELMLDDGFPLDSRSAADDGATALHGAAYAGSADVTRLLLSRGANLGSRDTTWQSTPLEWAAVGSGERPRDNPRPDWPATVRALLDAGASARDVGLSPDDPKPPSPEVAALLRAHGAGG